MEVIRLCSQAKINLFLNIKGVREDGYHEIETVMQSISLADRVKLEKNRGGIGIYCDLPYVPRDERNIAYKAANLFFEQTGKRGGVFIAIRKKVPVGAGLAGGSGNAAAVLIGLNELYRTGLSEQELCEMGAKLGADVPFCITGGTQLASGIGEQLSQLPPPPNLKLLIVKPRRSISTPLVYQKYDELCCKAELAGERFPAEQPELSTFYRELKAGNPAPYFANVLEPVTGTLCREVPVLLRLIERCGARAMMSGSGTAVFGVFEDERARTTCQRKIRAEFRDAFVSTAEPVSYGVRIKGREGE